MPGCLSGHLRGIMLGSQNEREIQRIISLLRDTKELKDALAGVLFMDCASLHFWRFFFFRGGSIMLGSQNETEIQKN